MVVPGGTAPYRREHPRHPSASSFPAELGMHPGVADAAESEQVGRVVVCRVQVNVVDMQVLLSAADSALLPVTSQDHITHLFPSPQGILLPRPDGGREPLAVDVACGPRGKRALVAEPAETVQVGAIPAERIPGTVERVQAQLEVGAHDQKKVGCGTG